MKLRYLLPLFSAAVLVGCSSQNDATPSPDTKLTSQQKIEKIQNDPKIPDGLKQIQINTLKRQPG